MFCQRCGKKNKADADSCQFCGAPLLVLRQEPAGSGVEIQAFQGIEDYLIDKISTVEKQAHRSSEDVDLLVQAVDYIERNVMVNRAGINELVKMLREKGILEPDDFGKRWRERTVSNLLGLYRKERFLEMKPRVLADFKGKNRRRFEDRVLRAEDLLYAFQPRAAVSALEEALALDPDNRLLLTFLGETYVGLGLHRKAFRFLSRAMDFKPRTMDTILPYVHLLVSRGEFEEAGKILARALRKANGSADALMYMALLRGLAGRWRACGEAARRALEIEHAPAALYLSAHANLRQNKIAAAESDLDRLLADYPDNPGVLYQRALLFLARGWWQRGEELLALLSRLDGEVDTEDVLRRFKAAGAKERRTMSIVPLKADRVLAMMDTVAEEAALYLRQMDSDE